MLSDNRELLEELTDTLVDKETVDYDELARMVAKYHPELEGASTMKLPAEASLM